MTTVFNTIKNRRAVGGMREDAVPRETIERMLEAATYAPNHHLTEPWRFYVIQGAARERFRDALKDVARGRVKEPDSEAGMKKIENIGARLMSAPTIIFIVYVPSENDKADPGEDRAAVAIAGQNLMLVAEEEGLNTNILTGPIYNVERFKDEFPLHADEEVYAIIPVGYSKIEKPAKRTHYEEKTVWLSE